EPTGSRQAIDKPNIKRGLKRGKPPADRGVIHFQIARCTGERAALRHRQEMPDVLPIDHLCGISRITRNIPNFRIEHSCVFLRRGDAKENRTPCQDNASGSVSLAWSRAGAGPREVIFRRFARSLRPSKLSASPTRPRLAPKRLPPRLGFREPSP